MPRAYRYRVVDVFTSIPLEGNALAVFPEAGALGGDTMQRIARELNLSETVFVTPSGRHGCAARLRIFTPAREMTFAGHPTIGGAWVLMAEGIVPRGTRRFSVEEGVGPVPVEAEAGDSPRIWLTTPPIAFGRLFDPGECARALGMDRASLLPAAPQMLDAGNATLFVALRSKEDVDRCWLDSNGYAPLRRQYGEPFCVFVFAPTPEGAYSRMFAPEYGIVEDPATGSSTGPLAVFMRQHSLLPRSGTTPLVSEQGVKMGRRSLLYFDPSAIDRGEGVPVGGHVTPVAEATLSI